MLGKIKEARENSGEKSQENFFDAYFQKMKEGFEEDIWSHASYEASRQKLELQKKEREGEMEYGKLIDLAGRMGKLKDSVMDSRRLLFKDNEKLVAQRAQVSLNIIGLQEACDSGSFFRSFSVEPIIARAQYCWPTTTNRTDRGKRRDSSNEFVVGKS